MTGVRMVEGSEAAGMGVVLRLMEATLFEGSPVAPLTVDGVSGQVLDASGALWSVTPEGAERLVSLGCRCGCAELVRYCGGSEQARFIATSG